MEGKCKNKECKAFENKVWIKKGFGNFIINKEVYLSKCPICNQNCKEVENMALYLAKCTAKGMKKGEE
jgi:hypothetical protein